MKQQRPNTFADFRNLLASTPIPQGRNAFIAFDAMKLRLKLGDPNEVEWSEDERVVRWKSNNRPVPTFVLRGDAGIEPWEEQLDAYARSADAEIAAYRASQDAAPNEEQLAEMRAAFGPGETIVDVITGRKTQL